MHYLLFTRLSSSMSFVLSSIVAVSAAQASVVTSLSPTTPVLGPGDQGSLTSGATNTGYDYGDHTAPGQSFTVPTTGAYKLNSVALKINLANSGRIGNYFTAGATFGLQIARFDNDHSGGFGERTDGDNLPFSDAYNNAGFTAVNYTLTAPAYDVASGNPWVTFTFTGTNVITLNPGTTYSFQVYNGLAADGSATYLNFFANDTDTYASGVRFSPYGADRAFTDNYVQVSGLDRTFAVDLQAVPEPMSLGVLVLGGILVRRFRA